MAITPNRASCRSKNSITLLVSDIEAYFSISYQARCFAIRKENYHCD